MRYSSISLVLAATVSAIDIRLFDHKDCGGSWIGCTNINPNVCCHTGRERHLSVSWEPVPRDWSIMTQVYWVNGCDGDSKDVRRYGLTRYCMTEQITVTGGRYYFYTPNSPGPFARDLSTGEEQACISQKPDVLALGDGQRYNISQLEDSMLEPLVELAFNGSGVESIPAIYDDLKIAS
ncbi:hypothetical protein SVAN01_07973 [Stagonosporopsis vannaccii]|nr:hypothetical protein SVAN01_07973 [Stagonosporopsis vannaccii]